MCQQDVVSLPQLYKWINKSRKGRTITPAGQTRMQTINCQLWTPRTLMLCIYFSWKRVMMLLDWSGVGVDWALLPHRRLHCTAEQSRAEQQTINQSHKACPSQEDSTKKAKQVSKRTRVHVCVLRSSTFLVRTEYLHEKERKRERKKSKQERKKECQFLLQCHRVGRY
jgi:hypothetical protein